MIRCALQIIFAIALLSSAAGQTVATAPLSQSTFTDVDGRELSTHDGCVTLLTVIGRSGQADADEVGARVPAQYLGDPHYRFVTVIKFPTPPISILRKIVTLVIRGRLDAEAQRLQRKYSERKIDRNARHDLFAVADFDGKITGALGVDPNSTACVVFLFGAKGELLHRWLGAPAAADLATELARARRR